MEEYRKKVSLKRDWVALFAILLFVLIGVSELAVVTLLPMQLRAEKAWEREVAQQEMVEMEDLLRAWLVELVKEKNRTIYNTGNARLAQICLDEFARYIRANSENLNREQIRMLYEELGLFHDYIEKFKKRRLKVKVERINSQNCLDKLIERCQNSEKKEL